MSEWTDLDSWKGHIDSFGKPAWSKVVDWVVECHAKNPDSSVWVNEGYEEAVARDTMSLLKYGATCGALDRKQRAHKRAAAKAAETKARRREGGIGMARDGQRQKLYDAEAVIRSEGRRFTSIEEMQTYTDRLVGSAWFGRRFSQRKINIVQGRAGSSAHATNNGSLITMPTWAWCEPVLLHEISHIVAFRQYGMAGIAPHGREFAKTYLELVRHKMGAEVWRTLKDSFSKAKVKHTLPRKPMGEEQRAAAAERLASVRAAKGAC